MDELFDCESEGKQAAGPVQCLGMAFPNEVRRRDFLFILRQKLKNPEFHNIKRSPLASGKDILALSAPQYYTTFRFRLCKAKSL